MARGNQQSATTPNEITGAVFIDGPAKSGKSIIFSKGGAVKAPVYLGVEELAAIGFDKDRPIRYAFWQD